ncbi:MAG: hypothetical protein JNL61_16860 [Rhizobiaceae bacterium]|nr:hypothetical protein [Rhizobiaceae bacterium]
MEHIAAVLLLVACSDDLKDCREVPSPTPIYESIEDCDGDLPFTMSDLSGKAPRILGTCVYVDPALEEEDAELVWDIQPGGTLYARVEIPNYAVAANQ